MIKPPPHKLICPQCNYSKVIRPKSDAFDINDFFQDCPKCSTAMKKTELATMSDSIKSFFSKVFGRR